MSPPRLPEQAGFFTGIELRNQCNAYEKPSFNFHPRHRADGDKSRMLRGDGGNPSVPAKTVPEFTAYAKRNPEINMIQNEIAEFELFVHI
jgi:hypothetical protein